MERGKRSRIIPTTRYDLSPLHVFFSYRVFNFVIGEKEKMISFTIPGRLDGLNEYVQACRSHAHMGAQMKKKNEEMILWHLKVNGVPKDGLLGTQIFFTWYEKDARRDIDNISFAKKFLLDAMVTHGLLETDSQKGVVAISDIVKIDKQNPRIEVSVSS